LFRAGVQLFDIEEQPAAHFTDANRNENRLIRASMRSPRSNIIAKNCMNLVIKHCIWGYLGSKIRFYRTHSTKIFAPGKLQPVAQRFTYRH
jgi:hypothetical protein